MSIFMQVEKDAPGIWQYSSYYPRVEKKFWLSLKEGDTPEIKSEGIIFKREDQNPTGSLKDRGMAYQVSWALSQGRKDLVISSSGNAAISAATYAHLAKIKLHAFVSPKISPGKFEQLQRLKVSVFSTPRPVSEAVKFSKKNNFLNLRPSSSAIGAQGYKSLAFELHQNLGKIESLFIPVSSGTALVGIAAGYKILGYLPRLHIVQTTAVCPLARLFDKDIKSSGRSLAEGLVAKTTPRKDEIIQLVKNSGGWGWVVSDEEIRQAWERLETWGISTSAEGAAALAGSEKAKKKGWQLGKTVCLLTGKKY